MFLKLHVVKLESTVQRNTDEGVCMTGDSS